MIRRRLLLAAAAGFAAAPRPSRAADAAPAPVPEFWLAERAVGSAAAPVTVQEMFSLTCTHCAAFAAEVFPHVKAELIDTGKVRYVFRDFPLDQVALTAAMVARALPPERYEPFVLALLASQDRWAFARGVNSTDELAKLAALAGLPRDRFDAVLANEPFRRALVAQQAEMQKKYAIDSTPSFVFDGAKSHGVKQSGELGFEAFARLVAAAG